MAYWNNNTVLLSYTISLFSTREMAVNTASYRQTTSVCVFSYAPVTLTLIP